MMLQSGSSKIPLTCVNVLLYTLLLNEAVQYYICSNGTCSQFYDDDKAGLVGARDLSAATEPKPTPNPSVNEC